MVAVRPSVGIDSIRAVPVFIVDQTGEATGTNASPLSTATNTLLATSDLTSALVNIAAIGDAVVVAATASQTIRVHRLRLNVAGANIITVKSSAAGATLEVLNFPAAGFLTYDFATRPWYKTIAGGAFVLSPSTTAQVNGVVEYVKTV